MDYKSCLLFTFVVRSFVHSMLMKGFIMMEWNGWNKEEKDKSTKYLNSMNEGEY